MSSDPDKPLPLAFPDTLPITNHVEEILGLLSRHQVVIVAGETGSGKTTQLPKICLAAGFGSARMIGHTQPRRLAARSVATRIAEELSVPLGAEVGYAVRFNDQVSDVTRIKLMTDGLLLTEIRRDRLLERYDAIIVDEAHERSLNVDFLLGYLKRISQRRRDLKIIITSATIDVHAFSRHFDDAPVVEVGGRSYPVDVRYLTDADLEADFDTQLLACLEDIETGPQARARDVLVFLPGEREIRDAAALLRRHFDQRLEILPLYARLSAGDQQRVFRSGRRRRVILATNVAETSITVPNIGYVIDPGLARISRYSFRSKLQRLPVEPISQASANQRAGRCGRIAPGVCYRLYSHDDFSGRPAYTDPEIKRTNLASVVLQMRAFRLGDPHRFGFLEPPDTRAITDAEKLLDELGATLGGQLTDVGHQMARLPVDPRLARMLIAADVHRALAEILVIVSALAIQDPRDRPAEKQGSADRAHAEWLDPRSDFMAFLKLWEWHETARQELTRARLRRALEKRFLSVPRMREWRELHRQLLLAVKALGLRINTAPADFASIHRALLSGSLSLIGQHEERGEYLGPRNLRFRIFPGSALNEKRPRWLVAGEITETRRVYARQVAGVEARWIEEAAGHLLKRRHAEPHWSLKRGEAQAYETVTLYGLILADRRRVSYTRIDPAASRALFLLEGLVRGALKKPPDFLTHNLQQVVEIRELENKGRRRDLLLDDSGIAALYEQRIPAEVASVRQLEGWLRRASPEQVNALFFTVDELCQDPLAAYPEDDFPAQLELRGTTFALRYRFAPGEADDGVSLEVPLGALNVVVAEALDWSVPGMFAGVCEQWLRSLPKHKRRKLTPIPQSVQALLPMLSQPAVYRQGRLSAALARLIRAEFGVPVEAGDWDPGRIDPHWLVNVQLFDEKRRLVDQGRDVGVLRERYAKRVEARMASELQGLQEQSPLLDFPEHLETTVTVGEGGGTVVAYPTLVDEGDRVGLRFLADERLQTERNRGGYARLALHKLAQTTRFLKKQLSDDRKLGLLYAPLGDAEQLRDELLRSAAWACFFEGHSLPQSAVEFAARLEARRGDLAGCFSDLREELTRILSVRLELLRELEQITSPAFAAAVADVRAQVQALVPADVLMKTPSEFRGEIPRYLEAARYRLRNLQGKVQRDSGHIATMHSFAERLQRLGGELGETSERWLELRFLLEEVRVGLFAEPLGGRRRTSPKRLDRDFSALERELGLI